MVALLTLVFIGQKDERVETDDDPYVLKMAADSYFANARWPPMCSLAYGCQLPVVPLTLP